MKNKTESIGFKYDYLLNVEAVSVIIETASLFSLSYTHYSLFANHRADFLYMQMEENKIKAGNVQSDIPRYIN